MAVGNDTQFANLCRAIGRPELAEDGRYATNPDRGSNRQTLIVELQQEFGKADRRRVGRGR